MALSPLATAPMLLHGLMISWWLEPEEIHAIIVGLLLHWLAVFAAGALWWWQRRKLRLTLGVGS
jgi:hypothetical protein